MNQGFRKTSWGNKRLFHEAVSSSLRNPRSQKGKGNHHWIRNKDQTPCHSNWTAEGWEQTVLTKSDWSY